MAMRYYAAFRFALIPRLAHVPRNCQPGRLHVQRMTFTGFIGTICWFPLRAIIAACVALRIHPNVLTLIGVHHQRRARHVALAARRFVLAGVIMIVANIFDFIDGKVALSTQARVAVRRLLGLDARSLLRPRARHRPDLSLFATLRPHRLRAGRRRWR